MSTRKPGPPTRTRILAMASALLAAGLALTVIRNPSSPTTTTAIEDPEQVIAVSPTPKPPSVSPLTTRPTEATQSAQAAQATQATQATDAGAGSARARAAPASVRAPTPAPVQTGATEQSTGRPSATASRRARPAAAATTESAATTPAPGPSAAPLAPDAGGVSARIYLQRLIEVSWTAARTNGLKTSCTVTLRVDDGKSVRKVKADTGSGRFFYAPSSKEDRDPLLYRAEKTCKIDGDSTTVFSSGIRL